MVNAIYEVEVMSHVTYITMVTLPVDADEDSILSAAYQRISEGKSGIDYDISDTDHVDHTITYAGPSANKEAKS